MPVPELEDVHIDTGLGVPVVVVEVQVEEHCVALLRPSEVEPVPIRMALTGGMEVGLRAGVLDGRLAVPLGVQVGAC